nr:MAG TPA: hypothetical protein [Caudoviricetes sp.]
MLKSGFCYSFCYSFCYFCFSLKQPLKITHCDKYNCHKIQTITHNKIYNIRMSYSLSVIKNIK